METAKKRREKGKTATCSRCTAKQIELASPCAYGLLRIGQAGCCIAVVIAAAVLLREAFAHGGGGWGIGFVWNGIFPAGAWIGGGVVFAKLMEGFAVLVEDAYRRLLERADESHWR